MYSYSKTNINFTTCKILVRIPSAFHYVLQASFVSDLICHRLTSHQQLKIVFQQTLCVKSLLFLKQCFHIQKHYSFKEITLIFEWFFTMLSGPQNIHHHMVRLMMNGI